jgi:hypothetical protein
MNELPAWEEPEGNDWPAHPMDGDDYLCYVCSGSLGGELYLLLTDWCIGVGGEAFTRHDMGTEDDGQAEDGLYTINGLCVHAKCLAQFLELQLISERATWRERRRRRQSE